MKLWLRVNADSPRDPRIGRLSQQVDVPPRHAFGMVVAVWCAMIEHAPDGDLSQVPDSTINEWAGSPSRRSGKNKAGGDFAAEFKRLFLDESGRDPAFAENQAKLLESAKKDRERKRRDQNRREQSADIPRTIRGNAEEVPFARNGTERNKKEADKKSGASEPASPLFENFRKRFYTSDKTRWADVHAQLIATMTTGCRFEGNLLRATVPQIEKAIHAVLAHPPRDHDKAIVFVLKKLTNPATDERGRTVTEATAARAKAEISRDTNESESALAELRDADPNAYRLIVGAAEKEFPGDHMAKRAAREAMILAGVVKHLEGRSRQRGGDLPPLDIQ